MPVTGSMDSGLATAGEITTAKPVLEEQTRENPTAEKTMGKLLDKPVKSTAVTEMDGLIKLILATALAVVPFYCREPWSFALFAAYLALVTLSSKIRPRTLLLSAASYGIVVLFPYFFGLLMSWIFYMLFRNPAFALQSEGYEIFLKLARLFLIWYISILYFNTTPMKAVIGMTDKLLTPLKWLRVPVGDYLKVIMCIVHELGEIGPELKKSWGENMRKTAAGKSRRVFKLSIKGISSVLVSLIVDSFQKLDKVQAFVEHAGPGFYSYRFKIRKYDGLAAVSMVILFTVVSVLER